MESKITAEKIAQPEFPQLIVPEATESFVVFTEETRTDEAGNEYQYTRKEILSSEQIDNEVAMQDKIIEAANNRKDELNAKRGAITGVSGIKSIK